MTKIEMLVDGALTKARACGLTNTYQALMVGLETGYIVREKEWIPAVYFKEENGKETEYLLRENVGGIRALEEGSEVKPTSNIVLYSPEADNMYIILIDSNRNKFAVNELAREQILCYNEKGSTVPLTALPKLTDARFDNWVTASFD